MTNIQAIDLLKGLEQSLDDYCELNDEGKTAFRMAITALEVFGISEQLPSAQPEKRTEKRTQTHACDLETHAGDSISRRAVLDVINFEDIWLFDAKSHNGDTKIAFSAMKYKISKMPSSQLEIIRCEDCKWWDEDSREPGYGYCMAMKHGYYSEHWEIGIYRKYKGDFYCADAEIEEEEDDEEE